MILHVYLNSVLLMGLMLSGIEAFGCWVLSVFGFRILHLRICQFRILVLERFMDLEPFDYLGICYFGFTGLKNNRDI